MRHGKLYGTGNTGKPSGGVCMNAYNIFLLICMKKPCILQFDVILHTESGKDWQIIWVRDIFAGFKAVVWRLSTSIALPQPRFFVTHSNHLITIPEIADKLELNPRAVEKQISKLKQENRVKRIRPAKIGGRRHPFSRRCLTGGRRLRHKKRQKRFAPLPLKICSGGRTYYYRSNFINHLSHWTLYMADKFYNLLFWLLFTRLLTHFWHSVTGLCNEHESP